MERTTEKPVEAVHPSTCPKGIECPEIGVPDKDGKFCKYYRPVTKACVNGIIVKGKVEKKKEKKKERDG